MTRFSNFYHGILFSTVGRALFFSVFAYVLVLSFEVIVGMGPGDAHLDEQTYLNNDYFGFGFLFGNIYYLIVGFFGFYAVIILQFFLYLSVQYILYKTVMSKVSPLLSVFLSIWFFDPYKIHIFSHVLKDGWVLFFLSLSFYFPRYTSIMLIVSSLFRFSSVIYYLPFVLRSKYFIVNLFMSPLFVIVLCILLIDPSGHVQFFLGGGNDDMVFQSYDRVPTFNDMGLLGDLVRAFIWPFLFYTGFFILFFSNIFVVPSLFGNLFVLLVFIFNNSHRKNFFIWLVPLSIFAFLVPGFTSFYRYIYPLVALLPVWLIMKC